MDRLHGHQISRQATDSRCQSRSRAPLVDNRWRRNCIQSIVASHAKSQSYRIRNRAYGRDRGACAVLFSHLPDQRHCAKRYSKVADDSNPIGADNGPEGSAMPDGHAEVLGRRAYLTYSVRPTCVNLLSTFEVHVRTCSCFLLHLFSSPSERRLWVACRWRRRPTSVGSFRLARCLVRESSHIRVPALSWVPLAGAIRNGDIIPWDGDGDVMIAVQRMDMTS